MKSIITNANKTISYIKVDYSNVGKLYIKDLQIIKGTIPKPYLPHGCIGLRQSGKNKFNCENILASEDGITLTGNKNGTITISGTCESTVYPNITKFVNKFNYSLGSQYILTDGLTNHDNIIIVFEYSGGGIISDGIARNISTIPTNAYIRVTAGTYNTVIKPMLRLSNTDDTYEPYHEPVIHQINLNGNSIAKVGDVKDLLKIYRNGDVEIEKNVEKINLGSLIWYDENEISSGQIRCSSEKLKEIIYNSPLLCTSYYFDGYKDYDKVPDKIICWSNSSSIPFWRIKNSNYAEKIDEMIISLNSVEVYCQLAEPETIKLPPIDPIELWEGTNKFELITNLDTTFEIEYVVDKDYLETQNLLNIVEGENI